MTEAATAAPASLFQGIRDRAAAKALPSGAFLSAEERAEMLANKTPFWIVDANETKSQFGERATFVIVLDPSQAPNGEYTAETSRSLDLGYSAYRGAVIEEMKPVLATHKLIGPLYLSKIPTKSGNDAWDITENPDEIPY